MIKAEQVPKEAAAAVDDLFENEVLEGDGPSTEEIIAAAINAWPEMRWEREKRIVRQAPFRDRIILPLTEKPSHD